jgi:dihydropteroate synthase
MGVVNVTPDSFSDGGRWPSAQDASAHAVRLAEQGADLLDVGGESSRPGAEPVSAEEERRRVIPAIEAIVAGTSRPVSVDTAKPEVARAALEAGASVVNDIGGLRDPAMARVLAETDAGLVLMHMAGTPRTMQLRPRYEDVVVEVYDYLARQVDSAGTMGIERGRIAIDPGIGFGKTIEHNLLILRGLRRFANLGCAVLVGTSRKGFLGTITGRPVEDRVSGSVTSSLAALANGADVVRVHDVGPMVDAIKVWGAVQGWGAGR